MSLLYQTTMYTMYTLYTHSADDIICRGTTCPIDIRRDTTRPLHHRSSPAYSPSIAAQSSSYSSTAPDCPF